jgi:repeat uncharacterized protein DUF346
MREAVTAISWGSGRLDIFGVARADNMVRHKAWANGWFPSPDGWEGLGRLVAERAIAPVTWGRDRIDIFGVGHLLGQPPDGQMIHQAWDGEWHPTEGLGGAFHSAPSAVSWGNGRLDIFALGTDDQMFHKAWADRWFPSQDGWEALGGPFAIP